MRIIVLGGTGFIGACAVEEALRRGHELVLINRGTKNAPDHPNVRSLMCDRTDPSVLDALDELKDERFDCLIDTCCFNEEQARHAAELFRPIARRCVLLSSVAVYGNGTDLRIDENYPTITEYGLVEARDEREANYGPDKARAEIAYAERFGDDLCVLRPGRVAGPGDGSMRFTYWPVRTSMGGEMLVPSNLHLPFQVIDVRDLGAFIVGAVERGLSGPFNCAGPAEPIDWQRMVQICAEAAMSGVKHVAVDERWLLDQGIEGGINGFGELPLWFPTGRGLLLQRTSSAKAIEHGLNLRPLFVTARDLIAEHAVRPEHDLPTYWLSREREASLIDAWRAQHAVGNAAGR